MAKKGTFYIEEERTPAYFAQGFRLGLVFGALGSVIMLVRGGLTPKSQTAETGLTTADGAPIVAVVPPTQPVVTFERTEATDEKAAELPAGTSIPVPPPSISLPRTDTPSTAPVRDTA